MTMIACPDCSKKISSRTAICSYCGYQLRDVTEVDLAVFRARNLRDRIYKLNMVSYAVITVFIGAFGWYWWDSGGFPLMKLLALSRKSSKGHPPKPPKQTCRALLSNRRGISRTGLSNLVGPTMFLCNCQNVASRFLENQFVGTLRGDED